jgi:tRNA-dihydrouridine synthase B
MTTLLLAPFQGITNKLYRNAMARHFQGFNEAYSPFISGVGTSKINASKLNDVIPKEENLLPTIPQFISTNAREIILLGKTFQDYGFDHINWNLGCPFPRIANKKRGCGMLPYPEELDAILNEVFSDFPIKLSIKTRLGYSHRQEIHKVIDVLNKYPVDLLIIHARIGAQVYRGQVDLEGFQRCLEQSKHPVAYNGDVYSHTRFKQLQQMLPSVNSWMLGRGALINPFLPMQIKGTEPLDAGKRILLKAFLDELFQQPGSSSRSETRKLGSLKAVWYYLAGVFSNSNELFADIKKSTSLPQYHNAVEKALNQPFSGDKQIEEYFRFGMKHV